MVYGVSVLFNEPKLLKFSSKIALKAVYGVSVLFNEPKLLKSDPEVPAGDYQIDVVSVLFNEPKLLKS